MEFYLDTSKAAETGTAILSLGNEPGGDVVATLPYETELQQKRANMLRYVPLLFEEFEGVRNLWWYQGHAKCGNCGARIEGASKIQIDRLEQLRQKMMPEEAQAEDKDVPVLAATPAPEEPRHEQ